ncbi:pirin family protein [Thiocystis violascens]|uniref:Pirin-related protein n=1 Tax=Thiocystis violascens (strain ATCC 17096 / DSM 198 / 6111) TaxID=765911 RepID=I3YD43_THIV6|nr:pirin family protein [Thiocystis violascens]AFL74911.1 Pirin-related protein [Thiocystis violascens DSM 198]
MLQIRPANERGQSRTDWLDSRHSFSFGDYHDPDRMGFSNLRVINEDRVAPGSGFPTHGHRDMEIVTYVLEGALEHRDSLGNGAVIRPGEVQYMSAGSGVQHSEFNHSQTEPVHLLQIWLLPNRVGIAPGYAQQSFSPESRRACLRLLVSPDGRDGSVMTHQDASLYASLLLAGETVRQALPGDCRAYVQVARGRATVNGIALGPGDGAALSEVPDVELTGLDAAEVLLFVLPSTRGSIA